jgi:hypothetical protein
LLETASLRTAEVHAGLEQLRAKLPWLPDRVVAVAAELVQRFAEARPDELQAVRYPRLWPAAAVHAAFMLHPHGHFRPLKPLTLDELADLCGVSVALISKRSGQLREGWRR